MKGNGQHVSISSCARATPHSRRIHRAATPNNVCSCQARLRKRLRRFGCTSLAAETCSLDRLSVIIRRPHLPRRALLAATVTLAASCLRDDAASHGPLVQLSYMVDTVSAEHKEVLDLWRGYLTSRPQDFKPTPRWSSAEQQQWKIFDLGGAFAYSSDGDVAETRATVFQIAPAIPGDSTEYVIRTMFTRPDHFQSERRTFLHRVYAMRESGRWVLSNALPRATTDWNRTTIERITYVHPPEHKVDTVRALKAMRFVDSIATAFDAPKPPAITYYLARSPEEVFRLTGIDFYLPGSRAYAMVHNYQIFSGVPSIGEFYAHELTHMVLGWILPDLGAPPVLDEALALWLGGGREMMWPEVRRELATELRRDSTWTLDRILQERPATAIYRLSAAAALLELAHQRGGMPALKAALNPPRDRDGPDLVEGIARALNLRRSDVEHAWRQHVLAFH
jgi:hypothetical protein